MIRLLTTLVHQIPPSASNSKPSGKTPGPYSAYTSLSPSSPSPLIGNLQIDLPIVSCTKSHCPEGSTLFSFVNPIPCAATRAPLLSTSIITPSATSFLKDSSRFLAQVLTDIQIRPNSSLLAKLQAGSFIPSISSKKGTNVPSLFSV